MLRAPLKLPSLLVADKDFRVSEPSSDPAENNFQLALKSPVSGYRCVFPEVGRGLPDQGMTKIGRRPLNRPGDGPAEVITI
jgi:hypothetical protein